MPQSGIGDEAIDLAGGKWASGREMGIRAGNGHQEGREMGIRA
jgi:hypothetical protein